MLSCLLFVCLCFLIVFVSGQSTTHSAAATTQPTTPPQQQGSTATTIQFTQQQLTTCFDACAFTFTTANTLPTFNLNCQYGCNHVSPQNSAECAQCNFVSAMEATTSPSLVNGQSLTSVGACGVGCNYVLQGTTSAQLQAQSGATKLPGFPNGQGASSHISPSLSLFFSSLLFVFCLTILARLFQ